MKSYARASLCKSEVAVPICMKFWYPLHLNEMTQREILDCIDVVNSAMLSGAELTRETCSYGRDILKKLFDALLARMRADTERIDFAAEAARMEREFEKELALEKLEAERAKALKENKQGGIK